MNEIYGRFVGRKNELYAFQQILSEPHGSSRIMYISGAGGIGKTWLARMMMNDAREYNGKEYLVLKLIDTYSTNHRYEEGIIDTIITQLKVFHRSDIFDTYDKEKQKNLLAHEDSDYTQTGLDKRLEELKQAFRNCLKNIVKESPIVLTFDTFEHVHNTPAGNWILSDSGLQMSGVICIIAGRDLKDQPDLSGLEREDMFSFYKHHYTLGRDLNENEKVSLASLLKKTMVNLDDEKSGYNPLFFGLGLDMFLGSVEELAQVSQVQFEKRIAEFLRPGHIGSIYSMPHEFNEPIGVLLTCMAYLHRRFNDFFLDKLIAEGFIQGITSDELRKELKLRLPELFFVKQRPEGELQLHDKLAELILIYNFSYAFDDITGTRQRELTDLVVKWYDDLISKETDSDTADIFRAEQLSYVLQYNVISSVQQTQYKNTDEALLLKQLLPPNFSHAKELLIQYDKRRSDILNRLIHSESQLSVDFFNTVSEEEQLAIFSPLANMAGSNANQARPYRQKINNIVRKQGSPEQQIDSLIELYTATWQNDLPKALDILEQALDICNKKVNKQCPRVLYWKGLTYRRMHDLENAVKWYEQALIMASEYKDNSLLPTILNDMGFAMLLRGNYKHNFTQARIKIQRAAHLREENRDSIENKINHLKQIGTQLTQKDKASIVELETELRTAKQSLGASYNTLGELHRYRDNFSQAIEYYTEALSIFREINNHYWQAMALQARGGSHRQLSSNLYYQRRYVNSTRHDRDAEQDIEGSLRICVEYDLTAIMPRSYRRMGRLLHDRFFRTDDPNTQKIWLDKSLNYLNKGLQVAKDTDNILEKLEILTEISFLGDDYAHIYQKHNANKRLPMSQQKSFQNLYLNQLQEGIDQFQEDDLPLHHLDVYKNLLLVEKAALDYESGNYKDSMLKYIDGFTGLAQDTGYGTSRCHRHFNHLLGNIRQLPNAKLQEEWCTNFISRWEKSTVIQDESQTVADKHADLFEEFTLYIDMGFDLLQE